MAKSRNVRSRDVWEVPESPQPNARGTYSGRQAQSVNGHEDGVRGNRTEVSDERPQSPVQPPRKARRTKRSQNNSAMMPRVQALVREATIDWGSTGTRVDWKLIGHSETIHRVDFDGRRTEESYQSPTRVAYVPNGEDWRLVCGHELQSRIDCPWDELTEVDVIPDIKLGFFEHADSPRYREALTERLQSFDKTRQDLINDYESWLLCKTTDAIIKAHPMYSEAAIKQSDLVVMIGMPDMYAARIDPMSSSCLIAAAKAAGATNAFIVDESVCQMTALFMDEFEGMSNDAPTIFDRVDDLIALCDFGGAFVSATTERVCKGLDESGMPCLETVSSVMSRPCGSTMIDHAFDQLLPNLTQVKSNEDDGTELGMYMLAAKLGYTVEEFRALARKSFVERVKLKFDDSERMPKFEIIVVGKRGARAPDWKIWTGDLTRQQVRELFDEVLKKGMEFLKARLGHINRSTRSQSDIKHVILTGGLMRNKYVKAAVEAALKSNGFEVWTRFSERNDAVCRGALFRYKNPRFYGFNRNFNLAVVRDEEANEYDHFDAVQDTFYDVDGETKVTWNRKLVCRGIFDRSLIYAKCRLNWIVEQNPEGNEGITEFESWAIDYPPLDEDYVFDSMLIYTKAAERRNGEALYQEDGITFHSHLKLYAVEPRQFSADEGRRENWEIVRHPTGRRTYRIAMCTRIFVSDGGWVLKRLVKRFDEIPEDAIYSRDNTQTHWLEGAERQILDPNFNPLPLSTTEGANA